jgi:hypothetical protein
MEWEYANRMIAEYKKAYPDFISQAKASLSGDAQFSRMHSLVMQAVSFYPQLNILV